ncbi:hypothetical protein PPNK14_25830 [Pectobacterium parmentieri]
MSPNPYPIFSLILIAESDITPPHQFDRAQPFWGFRVGLLSHPQNQVIDFHLGDMYKKKIKI